MPEGTHVTKPTGARVIVKLARARVSKGACWVRALGRGAGGRGVEEATGGTKLAVPSHEEGAGRNRRVGDRAGEDNSVGLRTLDIITDQSDIRVVLDSHGKLTFTGVV